MLHTYSPSKLNLMNKCTLLLAAFFFATGQLFAQCPELLTCPSKTDTFCDLSVNDAQLWNNANWWDPVHIAHDLPEGAADLKISVIDTCGGAAARYLLFLDLDGDGILESVVDSDSLPPTASVRFNNATNPGYSGGTLRTFDERPVTAANKYRFALEQIFSVDSLTFRVRWATDAAPGLSKDPQLPLGKHKIVWLVGTDTCTRDFVVRDCKAPQVVCVGGGLSVNIMPTDMVILWATDFLQYAEDNVTPPTASIANPYQIQFAIRKAGSGMGFPADGTGNPIVTATFQCTDLGVQPIELWARDKTGNAGFCQTSVLVQDNDLNCGVSSNVRVCACFNDSLGIEDAIYQLEGNNPPSGLPPISMFLANNNGCAEIPLPLPFNSNYNVIPSKDDNPLNGVSTYDLVLISKHIIGIEPLNTPLKLIAADANKSNSITTFDILEIRKLIMGIYNDFANNNSWRFVPTDYVFPNPLNPFATQFPESIVFNNMQALSNDCDFAGIKIGDVNGSAIANAFADPLDERAAAVVTLPNWDLQTGETAEIPLQMGQSGEWLGLQLSLQFNPKLLEIACVEAGPLPGMDENAWAQTQPGLLNMVWFDAIPRAILEGENLLTLRVRALAPVRLREAVTLSNERLRAEAYTDDKAVRGLQLEFRNRPTVTDEVRIFPPQPNPTTVGAAFLLRLAQPENCFVEVADMAGKIVFQTKTLLESGAQILEIPASAFPQTGVYVWRLQVGAMTQTGKIVRM